MLMVSGSNRSPRLFRRALFVFTFLAATHAAAQPLGLASDPLDMARGAIAGLRGSAAVGVWRGGKSSFAGMRDGAWP